MRRNLKIILFAVYFLLLVVLGVNLFFEEAFHDAIARLGRTNQQERTLTIGFSEPLIRLDPLVNDAGSRARLAHIFEGLVRVSPDLQVEPALAISYGALDDLTWEFRLRPGVVFHNNALLTVDDVIFSLQQAKTLEKSDVKDLASSIAKIEKVSESVFHITTATPDPLLLPKLSQLLIFPSDPNAIGIGTGPYELLHQDSNRITLKKFDSYWGAQPAFTNVVLDTFTKREQKKKALSADTIDILANVPPDIAKDFASQAPDFRLETFPSLEVNFLAFNFGKVFQNKNLREAVALALNVEELAKLTEGFAVPAREFVSDSVFGYDPSIPRRMPDPARAKALVREASPQGPIKTQLDLPKGLEVFGSALKYQLGKIGIDAKISFLAPGQLGQRIMKRESEFFFFGWKSDLGDALDFYTAVVHSPAGTYGTFNGGDYRNPEVDDLIETAQKTLKPDRRREALRTVMKKIVAEEIIGVPLFSPELLYAVSDRVKWTPRIDGVILAQEVKQQS